MDARSAADCYRQGSIENAPPAKIVRMLYEGALRFLDRALACDPADPSSGFCGHLERVDAIVVELRCALAGDHAPELARDLERLYLWVEERLGEAAARRSHEPLPSARDVLATLLEAWAQVEVDVARVA